MSKFHEQFGNGGNTQQDNNVIQNALNFQQQNNITDPKGMVQNLLNSGQMTQAQFNQLSQMANLILATKKGR